MVALSFDHGLSQQAGQLVKDLAQGCWRNAWCALEWMPELAAGEYVEGYAIASDSHIVFEHAWVELDGRVIDPSCPAGHLAYFPGLHFDRAAAQHAVTDDLELPVMWRCESDQYAACMLAHVSAWDYIIAQWPERVNQALINHISKMRAIYGGV